MPIVTSYGVRIPMSDGVELSADVWRPDPGPSHAVLTRTPYNKNKTEIAKRAKDFVARGFAFVSMDVRGRGDSDGCFRPYVNDAADGVDTIAWLAAQPWCSGKVATLGGSYGGLIQWLTAVRRPPALAAMVVLVTPADPYVEFPTGAQSPMMLSWHRLTSGRLVQVVDDVDWEQVYQHLPLRTMDERAGFRSEQWREELDHPTLDPYWTSRRYQEQLAALDLPVLHISGWYDDEQIATPRNFAAMTGPGSAARPGSQQLLMGPWGHAVNTTRRLGEVDFGAGSLIDLPDYQARWLSAQLDGTPWTDPPVRIFVMGVNTWRDEPSWPLPDVEPIPLYLHSKGAANSRLGDGELRWELPEAAEPADSYVYDPERPVPFLTPITSSQIGGPDDYSAVELRGDVLVYTGEALDEPLELTGPVSLVLHATTSVVDTDFTGKLLDVHPSGFAQRLCDGLFRARFREGFDAERPVEPGACVEYTVDLWHTAHVFLPGHRIRLEVASSAFPKFDRNLNTGEPIATSTRPVRATTSVHHDRLRPSHLLCPVVRRQH